MYFAIFLLMQCISLIGGVPKLCYLGGGFLLLYGGGDYNRRLFPP